MGLVVAVLLVAAAQADDGPPDVSGRWVLVQAMPALTALPFVGEVELTTLTVSLVDVEQDGVSLVLRPSYCFTELRMNPPLVQSRVPDAFVTCLRPGPRHGALVPGESGWRFVQDSVVEVRGAVLNDPVCDALPESGHDPRVIDQDGDGHPGLTVHVSLAGFVTGETYVVERLTFALDGALTGADAITGTVDWVSEQRVVAASSPLLVMSYRNLPLPDPARHAFAMRRVGSDWTCDTAREREAEILSFVGW